MNPRQAGRLLHINRVLLKYGLHEIASVFRPIGPLNWLTKIRPISAEMAATSHGERIRLALEELGPIFVKFGQALSTRRDLLPPDIADELAKLQDQVPPFPGAEAREIIEKSLGHSVTEFFAEFDETPLASASIAQVHAAKLITGEEVVIKVLRPGIEKQIRSDIDLLRAIAKLALRYRAEASRLRPTEIVDEYEKTIFDELDMLREAANAQTLRRNFEDSPLLYVPRVYWEYCRDRIMVIERVHGIPVGDMAALKAANVNFDVLSRRGVEIFFTQVFRDNFFHADMHAGNIFVDVTDPQQPKYIAIDFGIVGTLTPDDLSYLAQNFVAFFKRDYRRIAELHIESEWVPPGTRADEFESAIRSVSEPIFEKPLREISFGFFLVRLFQIGRRFNMEVQPQLVLLQKTLLQVEGLGRVLNDDLNLWDTAKPFFERWAAEEFGPRRNLEEFGSKLPELAPMLWRLLKRADKGNVPIPVQLEQIEDLRDELRKSSRRNLLAIAGGTAIITAVLMQFGIGISAQAEFWGRLLAGSGVVLFLYALFKS